MVENYAQELVFWEQGEKLPWIVLWFNLSWQLEHNTAAHQPLRPPPPLWEGEENWGKKVKLVKEQAYLHFPDKSRP